MSPGSTNRSPSLEQLSALADGELDDLAVGEACARWHADPAQRAAWHAYHLIGDVMRSDDLACSAAGDAAFLGSLRERLAAEPVVLAPIPFVSAAPSLPGAASSATRQRRHLGWLAPTAVAAGFVAVAGVLVVMRGADSEAPAAVTLSNAAPMATDLKPVVAAVPFESANEPPVLVVNGQLIRDAQLDRYLAAHKQFAGTSALGVPSAFLRSATSDASTR